MERERWKFWVAVAVLALIAALFVPVPLAVACPDLAGSTRVSIIRTGEGAESVELRGEACDALLERLERLAGERVRWYGFGGTTVAYTVTRYTYRVYGETFDGDECLWEGHFTLSDQGWVLAGAMRFRCDERLIETVAECFAR